MLYYTAEFADGTADVFLYGFFSYPLYSYAMIAEILLAVILLVVIVILGIHRPVRYIGRLKEECENRSRVHGRVRRSGLPEWNRL